MDNGIFLQKSRFPWIHHVEILQSSPRVRVGSAIAKEWTIFMSMSNFTENLDLFVRKIDKKLGTPMGIMFLFLQTFLNAKSAVNKSLLM